jgi:hypothetical protein
MSLRRRPRLSAMIDPSSNAISVMKPSVLRLAVFASWTLSGSSAEKVSAGRPSARSSASIASTRWLPSGRRSAAWTASRKTEKRVPAWMSRRHFCRSIQTRFRYQSSSDGGSSPSVVERTPRRSST